MTDDARARPELTATFVARLTVGQLRSRPLAEVVRNEEAPVAGPRLALPA